MHAGGSRALTSPPFSGHLLCFGFSEEEAQAHSRKALSQRVAGVLLERKRELQRGEMKDGPGGVEDNMSEIWRLKKPKGYPQMGCPGR